MSTGPFETWRDFFDAIAPTYEQNEFTKNTLVEVQFLLDHMNLAPGARILDVGCGTGRHAIELARRGFSVVGVDFSGQMLFEAKRNAESAGVNVDWIEANATEYICATPCDAAICLCEGAIGLIGHDEDALTHDLSIYRNIAASLKPQAPFILTTLNAYAMIRRMTDKEIEAEAFDPATMVARYADSFELPTGSTTVYIKERRFIPPEVISMMHHAGFDVQHVWGGTAGEWGERQLKLDEVEVMFVSFKR
ncbi:MAG: methyltransferase domain-containing protein [Chthonomonas sp.]|nr:methyltransferase domain-containing protein [Chthonomonas sp.]